MPLAEDKGQVRTLFPDDVKVYIDANPEGSYTLLDVRQPGEYEEAHLPGAKLIPLPRLADSLGELDPAKTVIVYCAVGGRSRMAAQLLAHQGFTDVSHMMGGIEAWAEPAASGPVEFHFQFIRGDESPDEMVALGYHMEEGLKRFHQAASDRTADPELSEVLAHLIRAEESHERRLLELIGDGELKQKLLQGSAADAASTVMEGGIDVDEFIRRNEPFMQTVAGYLDLAMMIETQALDLYLRFADASRNDAAKQVLLQIAEEEKAHLAALGRLLEEKRG